MWVLSIKECVQLCNTSFWIVSIWPKAVDALFWPDFFKQFNCFVLVKNDHLKMEQSHVIKHSLEKGRCNIINEICIKYGNADHHLVTACIKDILCIKIQFTKSYNWAFIHQIDNCFRTRI